MLEKDFLLIIISPPHSFLWLYMVVIIMQGRILMRTCLGVKE